MRVSLTAPHLAAGFMALWLAACGTPAPSAGAVPFTTIERKDDPIYIGQQQYNALDPGLLVMSDAEAAAAQADLFSEAGRDRLDRIDWRSQFVLAVFQGWQSGSGYGVTIDQVTLLGGTVRVYAEFSRPEPAPGAAVTSPYHLIAVRRPFAPVEGLAFELVVGSDVILVAATPTP